MQKCRCNDKEKEELDDDVYSLTIRNPSDSLPIVEPLLYLSVCDFWPIL